MSCFAINGTDDKTYGHRPSTFTSLTPSDNVLSFFFLPLIMLHTQQHQSKWLLWFQTRYWGQMSLIWMPSPRATDQHHNQVNHSHRRTSSQRKTDSPEQQKHRKQTEYQPLQELIKTLLPANWTVQGVDPDVSSAALDAKKDRKLNSCLFQYLPSLMWTLMKRVIFHGAAELMNKYPHSVTLVCTRSKKFPDGAARQTHWLAPSAGNTGRKSESLRKSLVSSQNKIL